MNITFEEMKDIAKTLPIGYYLGRKVEVTIDPGGGAYADVVKSVIHVGMDILKLTGHGTCFARLDIGDGGIDRHDAGV